MRNKIINLLRDLENEHSFTNTYNDYFGEHQCDYEVEEHLPFPNYRLIIRRYQEKYRIPKEGCLQPLISGNSIKAELKRMQMDGLIMIDTQDAIKYAHTTNACGPDYDDGASFISESIVLTTKGKSKWRYFLHNLNDNPVTTVISLMAIIISIISLFI